MTHPEPLLTPDRVAIDCNIASKRAALERVSALLANASPELGAETVFDRLIERELLGSTGLGHGAALPHARLGRSGRATGALLSLPMGVDFDAVDGMPVHMVFGLLVPEDAATEHLQILATLASAFRDPSFGERLRNAESPRKLYDTFIRVTADQDSR